MRRFVRASVAILLPALAAAVAMAAPANAQLPLPLPIVGGSGGGGSGAGGGGGSGLLGDIGGAAGDTVGTLGDIAGGAVGAVTGTDGTATIGIDGTVGGTGVVGHTDAVAAVEQQRAIPLNDLIAIVARYTEDRVIDVQLLLVGETLVYHIKTLAGDGVVSNLYFYAVTGDPVQQGVANAGAGSGG